MEGFGETRQVGLSDLRKTITEAFLLAVELKDTQTASHLLRVQKLSHALCKKLSLSSDLILKISTAALLHDVGKMALPDSILKKTTSLDLYERQLLELHVDWGYQMVSQFPDLEFEAKLLRSHHEWWNGHGYCQKLKAEQIPIGARIIAIADAYDAIVSERSYKPSYSHHFALQKLIEASGSQFDPLIVSVFADMIFHQDA